jgi:hypothetical protein
MIEDITKREFDDYELDIPRLKGFKIPKVYLKSEKCFGVVFYDKFRKNYSILVIKNKSGETYENFDSIEESIKKIHEIIDNRM